MDATLVGWSPGHFADSPPVFKNRVKCHLTGVEVTPLTKEELLGSAAELLKSKQKHTILGHNLHSAYLYHTDPILKSLYDEAAIVIADGKPIEFDALRTMKTESETRSCERLGSTDWLPDFLQRIFAQRIAVVGAMPMVNADFIKLARTLSPSSTILGIHGEDWLSRKDDVLQKIRQFKPNLVFVGLGMPLQEHFLQQNDNSLPECLYILVGGAIDQMTGAQKLAPRWVGRIGFEWAWRLVSQPKRLSERYLIEPWKLLFLRLGSIRESQK